MELIGSLNSPFVRRVAATLHHYGIAFEQRTLLTFDNFEEVLKIHPLGKVPAVILDDRRVLIESSYILDHFDHKVGPERSLTPLWGPSRTTVQQIVAVALGLAEKSVEFRTETVRRPAEKIHTEAVDRVRRQINAALTWLQARVETSVRDCLVLERMTQADLTTAIAVTNLRRKDPELLEVGFEQLLWWAVKWEGREPLWTVAFTND
jgi:glutathione S-transferase